jgi:hypothetical protein
MLHSSRRWIEKEEVWSFGLRLLLAQATVSFCWVFTPVSQPEADSSAHAVGVKVSVRKLRPVLIFHIHKSDGDSASKGLVDTGTWCENEVGSVAIVIWIVQGSEPHEQFGVRHKPNGPQGDTRPNQKRRLPDICFCVVSQGAHLSLDPKTPGHVRIDIDRPSSDEVSSIVSLIH